MSDNAKSVVIELPEHIYKLLEMRCNIPESPSIQDYIIESVKNELLKDAFVHKYIKDME